MNIFKKGFTLIELIIVIAIIGILAAGLLALLDPAEQFRKAQDAGNKQTAIEYARATVRFNVASSTASNANWPWCTSSTACDQVTFAVTGQVVNNNPANGRILRDQLIRTGELKGSVPAIPNGGANPFVYYADSSTAPTYLRVCFNPVSKSMDQDNGTAYLATNLSAVSATCLSQGGAAVNCLYCYTETLQ